MDKIQHIYWFASYGRTCPSTRYRGIYPLQKLKDEHGLSYHLVLPDRSLKGLLHFMRIWLLATLFPKRRSIVVIQKVVSDRFYAKMLRMLVAIRPKNTHYDLDDAEHYRTTPTNMHFFLKNCQTISVGSEALKQYSQPFNSNIFKLTSPVVTHTHRKKEREEKLHIGWVGDFGNGGKKPRIFSHKTSLFRILFPAIKACDFPLKLTLIGVKNPDDVPEIKSYFQNSSHVELVIPQKLQWGNDLWVYEDIAAFDVGLAPMMDHPYNHAKSAFKSKQYLSAGVPAVASDIGENRLFVKDGVNGVICHNTDDFTRAFRLFREMKPGQYRAMQHAALDGRDAFSIENYCNQFLERIRSLTHH